MEPDQTLRFALDEAYETFARYPRPKAIETSPVHAPGCFNELLALPLRALGFDSMNAYVMSAMTSAGDLDDFKYFLPRILELAAGSIRVDPDMIAGKLLYGQWRGWPGNEVDALGAVFRQAFAEAVGQHTDDCDALPWLCGAIRLGLDVGVFTRLWDAGPLPNAMLQLAGLFDTTSLFRSKLNGMWAEIDVEVVRKLRQWVLSEAVCDRLVAAGILAADRDIWMLDNALAVRDVLVHEFG